MPDAPPKSGTIGGIKKQYIYIGGGVLVAILGVVYFRTKSQQNAAAASTSATVTDPAGNVCTALDPNSGYCPGTAQDLAYQGEGGALAGTLEGTDASSYVGGQIIGYDQYGNPIYSSSTTQTGVPGGFVNNAEWAQAAVAYMTATDSNTDPETIANALGAYINGDPVTAAQEQLIEQAIAFEGMPPVGGTGGFPPGINTNSTGTGTGTTPPPPKGLAPKGSPPNVQVHKTTAKAIHVTWGAEGGEGGGAATSYNFGITPAPKGESAAMHNIGNKLSYNVGNLVHGTQYQIHVQAKNSAGVGPVGTVSYKA